MQEIKFPVQFVNALLQYLGTRPYQEVFQFVMEIQRMGQEQGQQQEPAGGTD